MFSDALTQPAHGALGPAKTLADFLGRETLQTHFQDRPLFFFQATQQLLDRLSKNGGLLGSRLACHGLPPWLRPGRTRLCRCLALHIPAPGAVILVPVQTLAQRDYRQEAPEVVPVVDLQLAFPIAKEKALVGGLHRVFWVYLASQGGAELAASESDELADEALKDLPRGCLVAGA